MAVYSRKVELKAYYPYGREITDLGYKSPSWRGDPFAFTAKPRLDWAGLPMQDFGARMYDSQTGRWNGSDPLAEKSMAWSPFAYCFDSPSTHIDPDGRWAGLIDYKKFHHNKGSGNPAESAQEGDAGWPGGPDGQAELSADISKWSSTIIKFLQRVLGSDKKSNSETKNKTNEYRRLDPTFTAKGGIIGVRTDNGPRHGNSPIKSNSAEEVNMNEMLTVDPTHPGNNGMTKAIEKATESDDILKSMGELANGIMTIWGGLNSINIRKSTNRPVTLRDKSSGDKYVYFNGDTNTAPTQRIDKHGNVIYLTPSE